MGDRVFRKLGLSEAVRASSKLYSNDILLANLTRYLSCQPRSMPAAACDRRLALLPWLDPICREEKEGG